VPVTVCIATIFRWNYGTVEAPDWGGAAIVLMDRMISAGDVEYEPPQSKFAVITPHLMLAIAGDYSVHTQAIKKTARHFEGRQDALPEDVAVFYGRAIQAIKLKEAEDLYLAPLGLNSDSFLAQQKDMAPHFVSYLTDQMQAYRGDEVDALIVGGSGRGVAIYAVDTKGIVTCADDVGFAAIGSGAWHAKSILMKNGFTNNLRLSQASGIAFAAKKGAEIAPGVGADTDGMVIFKDALRPLWPT